jgi:hypothetical protein
MARVDPDDDTIDRWVVWVYRYDPERRERRNVVEAAFDDGEEFERYLHDAAERLIGLKQRGEAEQVEHYGGVCYEAGYRDRVRRQRLGLVDDASVSSATLSAPEDLDSADERAPIAADGGSG